MLKHYLRVALRNLGRQKALTVINISGLSLGLACFILILLYSVNEFSYDRNHRNASQLYRVDETFVRTDGSENSMAGGYMILGPSLKKDFPDVADYARISAAGQKIMKVDNRISRISMKYADAQIFSLFTFPLVAGTPEQALKDPHSIVLTRQRAIQLFGGWDVVGRTVEIKIDTAFQPFTVSAVAEDIPSNTSISFDALGSYDYLKVDRDREGATDSWSLTNGDQTFVQLRPDSRLMKERDRLLQFRLRYHPDEAADYRKTKKVQARFDLLPLRQLHTTPGIDGGNAVDPKNIWILLSIAIGIVLIASINFTTLAIARSARRAKEVGVRKVVGSLRTQLIGQFLMESVLLSGVSMILGCLLAYVLLPWLNKLTGTNLEFSFRRFPELGWMLVGLTLLVGLLAGSYPALVLSGFNPVDVLKSKIRLGGSNFFTRGLVTFQFVLSISLVTATVIVLRQVNYMKSKDLGLIKENTVAVNAGDANKAVAYPLFRQLLQSRGAITGVTASEMGIGEGSGQMGYAFNFDGKIQGVIVYPVDTAFIPVMGLKLLAGRNFNRTLMGDTVNSIVVNETFVRTLLGKTPQEAIGQTCEMARENKFKTIIGVTADFNFEPLNKVVRPQLFWMPAHFAPSHYYVHLPAGDPTKAIAAIGQTWKVVAPDMPFRYSFLDEDLDRFYKSEERWGQIVACAGSVSIFLACLGLLGLSALAAANRIKEIGIRKIMGASIFEIVRLLTGGFLQLVLLSSLIATPLVWYVMSRWLRDFAYRIDIGWMVFAGTALMAVLIAFVTIGVQAMRAARANPVGSLRAE